MTPTFTHYSNAERIETAIATLSSFTEPDRPFTRLVFSPEFSKAREWLRAQFEAAGLDCQIDSGGNLVGVRKTTRENPEGKKVILGSHSDTVAAGGRFDGTAGLIAGLETIHFLNDQEIDLPFDIELVDFLGEELNVWGISCLGSRHMAGLLDDNILGRIDSYGRQLRQEIIKAGGAGKASSGARSDAATILACFELHIEQSDRLEKEQIDIGVVTDIPGIYRYMITVTGQAGHSGTTRMLGRKDALVSASQLITAVETYASQLEKIENRHFVATIGQIDVRPNGAATIPEEVNMMLDIRASSTQSKDRFLKNLQSTSAAVSTRSSCKIAIEPISSADTSDMDEILRQKIAQSANSLGLSHISLSSGAGHDMAHLSHIAPAAMIFIPCDRGLSHCPEEFTTSKAIAKGSAVLIHTILNLPS